MRTWTRDFRLISKKLVEWFVAEVCAKDPFEEIIGRDGQMYSVLPM